MKRLLFVFAFLAALSAVTTSAASFSSYTGTGPGVYISRADECSFTSFRVTFTLVDESANTPRQKRQRVLVFIQGQRWNWCDPNVPYEEIYVPFVEVATVQFETFNYAKNLRSATIVGTLMVDGYVNNQPALIPLMLNLTWDSTHEPPYREVYHVSSSTSVGHYRAVSTTATVSGAINIGDDFFDPSTYDFAGDISTYSSLTVLRKQ